MPSIKTALKAAAKQLADSDSPLLEAEILLCKVLNKDRSFLRAWPEYLLTLAQNDVFSALLAKRQRGEPIAYLTGVREFWSREFMVNPGVLIPRPETELIVELSLALIPEDQLWHILDLGTGSGIIAITLAAERPLTSVTATDSSPLALQVTQTNAESHKVNNVDFLISDWFSNIPPTLFDLIVSNPPYIAEGDPHLNEGDLRFEPKRALIAEDNGLADISKIAENARQRLTNGGFLMLEHGFQQGQDARDLLTLLGYTEVHTHPDLAGLPRVTAGRFFNVNI